MLFKKPLFGILALVSVLLCIWSLPSAYGYWMYATGTPYVDDEIAYVELKYFPLRGEDNIEDEGEAGETTQMDGLGIIIDALNNNTNNGSDNNASTTETTAATTDASVEEMSGCGSSMGLAGISALALVAVLAVVPFKKKEEN